VRTLPSPHLDGERARERRALRVAALAPRIHQLRARCGAVERLQLARRGHQRGGVRGEVRIGCRGAGACAGRAHVAGGAAGAGRRLAEVRADLRVPAGVAREHQADGREEAAQASLLEEHHARLAAKVVRPKVGDAARWRAIAAGAPRLLIVRLHALADRVVNHEAHVRLVDALRAR
jgi:hypothetical protein